jgi:hypothetical protein
MQLQTLQRLWGSVFRTLLFAPAPLGQYCLYISTCSGDSGAASAVHFYVLRRSWGSISMHGYWHQRHPEKMRDFLANIQSIGLHFRNWLFP